MASAVIQVGVEPSTLMATALLLGGSRSLGVIVMFPVFTLFNITGILRIGLAIGISAPVIAATYAELRGVSLSYASISALALKEFGVGILLGAGLGLPFWAAQAAGDLTDLYRGASQPNIFDQVNALETTTLGQLLLSLALVLFISAGGLLDLFSVFYTSFTFWPVLTPWPEVRYEPLVAIVQMFVLLFKVGAVLASPFMTVAFAVELSFSYMGRAAKQLPLDDTLPAFKNLAVFSILVIYTSFIGSYVHDAWTKGFEQVNQMLEVPGGR
ncbi:EscT/YscT/HrcT family type III secretion system export apparatus protein [Rhizobium helianthi]|uniref:EscT/YscT/HrcT family type III secretion system export apparatus protein n=1 Tax=Rhizobium helianthi TaxID=1132695 RepID=A0ABW4M872_9HYPH